MNIASQTPHKIDISNTARESRELDRKNKIRGLGRDRLKKRARNNNEDVKLSNPTDPTDFLGIVSKNDFIMDSYAIGKGSFGFVVLGKHKRNNITYALKQTRKVDVIKKKGIKFVLRERSTLKSIKHPFIVSFVGSFQDRVCLYLVLEYVPGGDLGWLACRSDNQRLLEDDARFYAAEMVIGLKYLHRECGLMHRDIKPDNVLIDAKGHIKLGDFGFAKKVNVNGRCHSHLGTPHFLAPEQLDIHNKNGYTTCVDWWSFAVTLYVLVAGEGPFGKNSDTRYEVYLRVMKSKYKIPKSFSSQLKKLIKSMFLLKEKKRLTDVNDIISHKWFADIDWDKIESREATPPQIPSITKNGKNNFTKVELRETDNEEDMKLVNNNYEMFAPF
jgi:serine/threonine protein kinase